MAAFIFKPTPSRYVVIDVETTGLSPSRGDRIIEVGALALEGGAYAGEFNSLVDAGRRISPGARKINGISDAMLKGAPGPSDVFPALHQFIEGATLVAHNAQFDLGFLRNEFKRLGLDLPNRYRCTYKMSRRLYPQLRNHQLDTVYRHLFGGMDNNTKRHRALDDARLTFKVWLRMTQDARSER
jgi:DNA polymerase-3 subunit epsilon